MEEGLAAPCPGGRMVLSSVHLPAEARTQGTGLTCPGAQREQQGRLNLMGSCQVLDSPHTRLGKVC